MHARGAALDTRFHCVYLLASRDPQCAGDRYVGYSVDPLRRLRQHNGALAAGGARRTRRRGRPWALLCCVSGFGEDRAALKFEWCWQHPEKSARLREAVAKIAALRASHRLPHAVAVLHLLLRAEIFARLPLTLHVFEAEMFAQAVAEVRQRVPALEPLGETPLLTIETTTAARFQREHLDGADAVDGDAVYFIASSALSACGSQTAPRTGQQRRRVLHEEDAIREHAREKELLELGLMPCTLCAMPLCAPYFMRCARTPHCGMRGHLACLAMWFTHRALQPQPTVGSPLPNADHNNNSHNNSSCSNNSGHYYGSPRADTAVVQRATLLPRESCGCPLCDEPLVWTALIYDLKRRTAHERRWCERQRQERMEAVWRERLQRIGTASKKTPAKRRRGEAELVNENSRNEDNNASKSFAPVSQRGKKDRVEVKESVAHSPANILPLTEFNEAEWLNF